MVRTIVGVGLFDFGDIDGQGGRRPAPALPGLAYGDGKLYIADTYNNKIKVCTPQDAVGQDASSDRTRRATATIPRSSTSRAA